VEKTPDLPAIGSKQPDTVQEEQKTPPECSEEHPAEDISVPVKCVKFAEPNQEPPQTNQRGNKKMSKFKSSRLSSKK